MRLVRDVYMGDVKLGQLVWESTTAGHTALSLEQANEVLSAALLAFQGEVGKRL